MDNRATSGAMCYDQAERVFKENPTTASIYSYFDGFNDMRGTGADTSKIEDYRTCMAASVSWLATPSSQRLVSQGSAGVSRTGTWVNTPSTYETTAKSTSVTGSTIAFVTSPGKSVQIYYLHQYHNNSTFSVTIDGIVTGTESTYGYIEGTALQPSLDYGVALAVYDNLTYKPHVVEITAINADADNFVHIIGVSVSSDSVSSKTGPYVYVGNILRMNSSGYALTCGGPMNCNNGSDTAVGLYDAAIDKTIGTLQNEGFNVQLVDVTNSQVYDPTISPAQVQSDNIHPNATATTTIAEAFISASTALSQPKDKRPAGISPLLPVSNVFTGSYNSFSGNIGIGTTSPNQKLVIDGGSSNGKVVANVSSLQGRINLYRWSGTAGIFNASSIVSEQDALGGSLLKFQTSISAAPQDLETLLDRMAIDNKGNVGIGTTSPGATLDISSGNYAGSESPTLRIGADVGTTTRTDATRKLSSITQIPYTLANMPYLIVAGDSSSTSNKVMIGGGFGGYNSATSLSFLTGETVDTKTGTERMTINNLGNIGIGTTDPKTKLEVDGIIKTKKRATATCDVDSEGGIYYDSDDKHFYGCNGTTWTQLDI